MSVTRILCNKCEAPLAYCQCNTRTVTPTEPVKESNGTIDLSHEPVTYATNCATNDYTPKAPKKKGRSKFF